MNEVLFTQPAPWMRDADRRKAEGHLLRAGDDQNRRLIGFIDATTCEWCLIPVGYLSHFRSCSRPEDLSYVKGWIGHMSSASQRVLWFMF